MSKQQKRYIIEKHVIASSVQEAISKEAETPITSVFPASKSDEDSNLRDGIGFKVIDSSFPYEY